MVISIKKSSVVFWYIIYNLRTSIHAPEKYGLENRKRFTSIVSFSRFMEINFYFCVSRINEWADAS